MNDIIMLAYEYLDDFRTKDYYQEFVSLSLSINTKYEKEINHFNDVKREYEEVLEIGRYHPDIKEVTIKYRDAKVKFFEVNDIKRYFELERQIELEINELFNEMTNIISPNIPVLNKFGLINSNKGGSCSGNCR